MTPSLTRVQKEFVAAAIANDGMLVRRCRSYRHLGRSGAWLVGSKGFSAKVGDNLETYGYIAPLRLCDSRAAVLTLDGTGVRYRLTEKAIAAHARRLSPEQLDRRRQSVVARRPVLGAGLDARSVASAPVAAVLAAMSEG